MKITKTETLPSNQVVYHVEIEESESESDFAKPGGAPPAAYAAPKPPLKGDMGKGTASPIPPPSNGVMGSRKLQTRPHLKRRGYGAAYVAGGAPPGAPLRGGFGGGGAAAYAAPGAPPPPSRVSRPMVCQNSSELLGINKVNINCNNNNVVVRKNVNGDEVEEIAIETGQAAVAHIPKWQRLIGNYQMSDIGDIIDELAELVYQHPEKTEYRDALKEARDYQFANSLKNRKKVTVRKDFDHGQFKKRAAIDYNRKEIDEHYRVINEGHERGEKEKSVKRLERPKQDNYGTKKYLPHLHGIPQPDKCPDDWL